MTQLKITRWQSAGVKKTVIAAVKQLRDGALPQGEKESPERPSSHTEGHTSKEGEDN